MSLALVPPPAPGGESISVLQNLSLDKMRWTITIDLAVSLINQILGILEKFC